MNTGSLSRFMWGFTHFTSSWRNTFLRMAAFMRGMAVLRRELSP